MQTRHSGGQAFLHTQVDQPYYVEIVMNLFLEAFQSYECVELGHCIARITVEFGDILYLDSLHLAWRRIPHGIDAAELSRDDHLIKDVLYHFLILISHSAVVLLVTDIHLQFVTSLRGKFKLILAANGINKPEQLL